jgi:ATP-binding cassette subfamily B protein/subfamily B ATP-binding cassette protein MsbA
MRRQSLQAWNDARLADSQAAIVKETAALEQYQSQLTSASGAPERSRLNAQIELAQTQIELHRAKVRLSQWLRPWLARFFPTDAFATVILIAIAVAVATAVKQFLMLSNTMLVSYVTQSIARDVRGRIFDRAISLDRPSFDTMGISGFTAHITHTTDMLASGMTSFYGGAITEPLRIVACLIGACLFSWRLTFASLIFAPLAAYLILYLNRQIRGISLRILDRSMGFHHVMLEVFNSLLTVQANTMEDFERRRFRDSTTHIRRIAMKYTLFNSLSSPVTELFGIGMLCVGVIVSGYLVINDATHLFGIRMTSQPLNPPQLTVFVFLLVGAADPLRKLSGVITGINNGMAAANLLYPLMDAQPRVAESATPRPLPKPHGQIQFRDIVFSYDGVRQVLQRVDLTIERGERLAIVGPNGGGKSTLVNLLCRFYDPQQGTVLIDDVSIRDVALQELRGRIALVTQQTELFNETILHNIRYGRWDASFDEVMTAAKLARAHEFITQFPSGYYTLVGPNGQRLSGGQRQRIALARALLRNAEILILDEATSQIDVESERLIHDALAELGRERTLIMITHRESTLSLATRIVRVDNGKLEVVAAGATKAA